MKYTVLYLHDSTACWMQWRGKRLLQVYSEPVTREIVERATSSLKKDGIQTMCPWLNVHSPQVKLLIDPVIDQSKLIPSFDHGFTEPHGLLERFRQLAEQVYLTCRSLTSDVLADDLVRYRHDRLKNYPNALLQWHQATTAQLNLKKTSAPRNWLVSETGLSDYVFTWLNAMAENGLEFVDVQVVCSLFAVQDAHLDGSVITIWVQSNRCRLIQCSYGFVNKIEQWNNPVEARIALQEAISELSDEGLSVKLRYVGCDEELTLWQEAIGSIQIEKRCDGISDAANYSTALNDVLPDACLCLPHNALIRSRSATKMGLFAVSPKWEPGASILILLSIARWKRRYKQTVIATTFAATFSGYFVLLACMHAVKVIELHERANVERTNLSTRQSLIESELDELSLDSESAAKSIERLTTYEAMLDKDNELFLEQLANILLEQPHISLSSVSWRFVDWSVGESEVDRLEELSELTELNTLGISKRNSAQDINGERLLLISGSVMVHEYDDFSHQQALDDLSEFLQALAANELVQEIVPLINSVSNAPIVNIPSDVLVNASDRAGFVLAVKMVV